ncbi:hexb2 [Gossypium arboreum]|uniref:Beta-hexosaminidase n=1 Tax=Gossypium arboreum TaxID=29729 RepID=A0A0B0P4I8_GOSAR|nr:hexb2 [Gossypium arboreum]
MGKMGSEMLIYVLLLMAGVLASGQSSQVKIWPMPASVSYGHTHLYLTNDFGFSSNYGSEILKDAFDRMLALIKLDHVIDANFSAFNSSSLLQGLHIVISSPNGQLQYDVDESYKLIVPSPEKPAYAHLEAKTVYGALQGLQTFSQLCYFSVTSRVLQIDMSPWTIIDQPRFSYRGLLIATNMKGGMAVKLQIFIDTSRHYLPVPVIKKVIDSMSYAKLNVMHWHIVDTQSFPLEIPSYPKLWDGAYSPSERYTVADAADIVRHVFLLSFLFFSFLFFFHMIIIVLSTSILFDLFIFNICSYAQKRGINVLAEIDVPGHALSWGTGYPSLWPSKDCQQPLDVSNEFTFKVIDGILSGCWTTTPRIRNWLKKRGMNESQAYQYFVLRAQNIALSHGYEIINWLGGGVAQRVVASGLRCIVSNQDKWYLDHLDTPWQEFYANEPLTNITNLKQQKLVIGGEVCMWGETVDGSDIEQTIWPRAAAAAERLWTPFDKLAKNPRDVTGRLAHFRCLLNQRGVAAAPVAGLGRAAPEGPGSCYRQ